MGLRLGAVLQLIMGQLNKHVARWERKSADLKTDMCEPLGTHYRKGKRTVTVRNVVCSLGNLLASTELYQSKSVIFQQNKHVYNMK